MSKLENPADLRTWWCLYLGCTGIGLTSITDQLCNAEQKLFCLAQSAELRLTDIMGSMGLCLDNSKCLCIQSGTQIIPTKPFIEVIGIRVFGSPKPSGLICRLIIVSDQVDLLSMIRLHSFQDRLELPKSLQGKTSEMLSST